MGTLFFIDGSAAASCCFLLFLAAVIDFSRGVKDGLMDYCGWALAAGFGGTIFASICCRSSNVNMLYATSRTSL